MILIPIIVIAVFIVFFIRRENKQALIRQWQLAADSLERIKCDPGGTLSGNPTLYGYVEGRRIDVAAFLHREFGSTSTQMTGYRIKRNSEVDLPSAAITSLTNHFSKFEVDSERIFCGTNGIENSASNLTSAINRIAAALRLADTEHAKADLAQSEKDLTATLTSVTTEPPPPPAPDTVITEIPDDLPADQIPAFLRRNTPDESPPIADAIDAQETPVEVEPEPDPSPEVEIEAAPVEIETEPALTLAARDLFASGHNHFETTQRYSSDYDDQEISGRGELLKVTTYSNDRTFGRGPGVVAEIEIPCPALPSNADDENPPPTPPSPIVAVVALQIDEDTTPSAAVRKYRDRTSDRIDLVGTLTRCDPFDHKLYLTGGIID